VSGDVDMSTAVELREAAIAALSAPDTSELQIDLAGVTFLDSSGLGALVAIRGAADELSRTVTIVAVSTRAYQVIEVCGLVPVFGLTAPDSISAAE
jgi:anti-sigma B factor antagonist